MFAVGSLWVGDASLVDGRACHVAARIDRGTAGQERERLGGATVGSERPELRVGVLQIADGVVESTLHLAFDVVTHAGEVLRAVRPVAALLSAMIVLTKVALKVPIGS
ncbi:MAG TPA: hypothetical protein VGL78_13925 [Solirubrobacteraceae bacterium]